MSSESYRLSDLDVSVLNLVSNAASGENTFEDIQERGYEDDLQALGDYEYKQAHAKEIQEWYKGTNVHTKEYKETKKLVRWGSEGEPFPFQ